MSMHDHENLQNESFEDQAIREMNEPLATRPMRQGPPSAAVFEPAELDKTELSETAETVAKEATENIYEDFDNFDEDAPLKTRPLKKD